MKKIEVVSNKMIILIEGQNIDAINKPEISVSPSPDLLIIKDGGIVKAVFRNWDYWRETE